MASANRVALFYITKRGRDTARRIATFYPDATCSRVSPTAVKAHWSKGANLVFVMASGIAVRTIAPLLADKRTDPAVVVLDELGEHVISLLSGHVGGANRLAREIAAHLSTTPVITTASDVIGLPSVDLWAQEQGLEIEDWKKVAPVATRLVETGTLRLFSDVPLHAPPQFIRVDEPGTADLFVTNRVVPSSEAPDRPFVLLRPKNLVAGVGCNSNTSEKEIEEAIRSTLDEGGFSFLSLRAVGTIVRKGDEPGLRTFVARHSLPLLLFSAEELNGVPGVELSEAARKATGAKAVSEPSAILGSEMGELLVRKRRLGNVTIALAQDVRKPTESLQTLRPGNLYVVGTGPGNVDDITPRALKVIRGSDVIVGYGPYLDLVKSLVSGKETVSTGMTREMDRCKRAIQLARKGRNVSVISGGDPGIYAMAGLVLELLKSDQEKGLPFLPVRIIPGISALNACAALAGAPLMHDFAAISLSDRLTPWQTIESRVDAAARADFVIALYNPKSKGRAYHVNKAQQIILKHRSPDTPVAVIKSATRTDEKVIISDLGHMPFDEIDMRTTVIIGNSKSIVWQDMVITPRGYEKSRSPL
jgi:cobalt-precorrin 5A hydrolase/precorrin-3B C17-methyltransferase